MSIPILFLLMGLFLFMSAFFSCAETTLFSLSKIQLMHLEKEDSKKFNKINKFLLQSKSTLITILLANTIVNIAASLSAGFITEYYFKAQPLLSFLFGIFIATFLILIIGEVVPKSLAIYRAENIALLIITPVSLTIFLLAPIQKILTYLTNLILDMFNLQEKDSNSLVNEEEIKNLISMGEATGAIKKDERTMIHSIFDLGETTVDEIMTPRTELNAVSINSPRQETLKFIKHSKHRRILIYGKNIDEIIGVLHLKDVMLHPERDVHDLMRKPLFIPPKKELNSLLEEFQRTKSQIAVILDEYGGTAGIITMHDLLEEIVGKIRDMGDKDEIIELKNGSFLLSGKVELEELGALLNIRFPEDMGRTISGLIMNMLGKLPGPGEAIEYYGYKFRVNRMEGRRIIQVLAQKI